MKTDRMIKKSKGEEEKIISLWLKVIKMNWNKCIDLVETVSCNKRNVEMDWMKSFVYYKRIDNLMNFDYNVVTTSIWLKMIIDVYIIIFN